MYRCGCQIGIWVYQQHSHNTYQTFAQLGRSNITDSLILTHLTDCRKYALVDWVNIKSVSALSPVRAKSLPEPMPSYWQLDPSEQTDHSETVIKTHNISFKQMRLKMAAAKWRPFCPGGDKFKKISTTHQIITSTNLNFSLCLFMIITWARSLSILPEKVYPTKMWTVTHKHILSYANYPLQLACSSMHHRHLSSVYHQQAAVVVIKTGIAINSQNWVSPLRPPLCRRQSQTLLLEWKL